MENGVKYMLDFKSPIQGPLRLHSRYGPPDRSVAQGRPLSRGSDPCGCPHKPLVSYRIDQQLSGWILPPLMIRAFEAHHQVTTYFDTPDGVLEKAGMTLRVRRSGNTRIPTVKSRPNGRGAEAVSELELELKGGDLGPMYRLAVQFIEKSTREDRLITEA